MADQDIIALLREQIDAYGAGDNDRMVATVTDDIIYNELGTGRRVEGRQEVAKYMGGVATGLP